MKLGMKIRKLLNNMLLF